MQVSRLRRKIEADPQVPMLIKTVEAAAMCSAQMSWPDQRSTAADAVS